MNIRSKIHRLISQILESEPQRQPLKKIICAHTSHMPLLRNSMHEYFSSKEESTHPTVRSDVVFITSRFRSGSTLLWNLFRQAGMTSYYEPFNERRWFDKTRRGSHTDNTHRGVNDYWTEYDSLPELEQYYNEDWIRYGLLMDENASDINMLAYINTMITKATSRPVLQFNRIDFRLPWIKRNYPNAKILHLYRHPRDQWCSFLTDANKMNAESVEKTYQDAFYLNSWCEDLCQYFPFLSKTLSPHPYSRFYYLWKLSYLFGKKYSDVSISFEQLVSEPKRIITHVFGTLDVSNYNLERLSDVIEAPKLNRWKNYASERWFEEKETECETILKAWLSH